ncbi:MAG: helix-turn-helix domain-containing protein [Blastocatellales bacterium]
MGRRFSQCNVESAAACSGIPWSDRHESRSCKVASPFCKLTLKGLRPLPPAYPKELNTLGDWIRKTRLDQGLFQEQVAQMLGVTEQSVTNWELHYNEPEALHIPRIIEFIGYCPYDPTTNLIDRVETIRRAFGLTQEQFSRILKVDESSFASWVRREHKPVKRSVEILRSFLADPGRWIRRARNS